MLSNARGKHSSPGVYIEEIDMPYASKSLGATTLGVVGETLKGPAFEPIRISDWSEFQEYFGGTSTEKFKGNQYPKYELPYIAKSYLEQSKQLEVCRVLGFSGYDAGPAWVIAIAKNNTSGSTTSFIPKDIDIIAVLRSKASYSAFPENVSCNNQDSTGDTLSFLTTSVTMSDYSTTVGSIQQCASSSRTETIELSACTKCTLTIKGHNIDDTVGVSLNPVDKDYILNVLGNNPSDGKYSLYVEEIYDNLYSNLTFDGKQLILLHSNISGTSATTSGLTIDLQLNSQDFYKESFIHASTPWFVSEYKGNELKKLFRFHTISDGNCANYQIKISISNILPDEGLFDILIRDFNDTDSTPIVLERYTKCNLIPGTSNYLGLKIGTSNGDYANKSKYVTVEINENNNIEECVPCGFMGYPMRNWHNNINYNIVYNKTVNEDIKLNRQYFGLSDIAGVDIDMFKYKGKNALNKEFNYQTGYTPGFHLDSTFTTGITVDGVANYKFNTPDPRLTVTGSETGIPSISSENVMANNIYADKRLRKFTCYFYGGFDGWDIYRDQRTNTDAFRANKYKGNVDAPDSGTSTYKTAFTNVFSAADDYGLKGKIINSDYYAYLAGYKQFDNPNKIKINLLATPGIDYVNNTSLVNEVLDIVEEYRQGDCLYIVTTPDTDNAGIFIEPDEAVANLEGTEISTSYAATFYPWVKYYDTTDKKYINLPVTKDVVRNFAYTDNVSQPWFASAGMSRGNVDCIKASIFTKLEDEDTLYEGMINPVKSFSSDGVKIWGNKTMYFEDTPLNRINVRRLMIKIKDLVMTASKQLVFEQNDNTVEQQFRSLINPILADAKQKRGISDYKIKTDTSAEARDRKELPAKIWVKPINCLEYIPISFVITPEGASFED